MSLSHADVLELLALLDASGYDELRVETADYKLYLNRTNSSASVAAPPTPTPMPTPLPPPPSPPPEPAAALPTPAAAASGRDVTDVKAPLLGTYYGAPQPGAPPFAPVGTAVEPDTVVAIVEVMKLMNSVCAGTAGVVIEVLARDGQLVEYGEPLLRIARSSA